jgi:Fe-S-cluster containining protein
MKGTDKNPVRCVALVGTPGERVSCSIYESRSSTCREFDIFNEDGRVNEACTRARAMYGLSPIELGNELPNSIGNGSLVSSEIIGIHNDALTPDTTHL